MALPGSLPVELTEALKGDPAALACFQALAPSCQREHAPYVGEAKKAETRRRRAEKTIEMLRKNNLK